MLRLAALAVSVTFADAGPAAADPQRHENGHVRSYADEDFWERWEDRDRRRVGVPTGHLPPPGLCRVWRAGHPAGRQAPPVDCDRAHAIAARDPRKSVLHSDGRLRRSYSFGQYETVEPDNIPAGRYSQKLECEVSDPNAGCVRSRYRPNR